MSKIVDSIIGHAIGDAMGVPTEFLIREKLQKHPVVKMIGYGSHDVPAGCWSDDTTMEVCLLEAFVKNKEFNYDDTMHNFYDWLHDAKFTATDEQFDAGRTCIQAIINWSKGVNPLECGLKNESDNGNGSLMRILPVALYSYYKELDDESIIKLTNEVSSLTHAHEISKLGCYIYVRYIMLLLDGLDKKVAYQKLKELDYSSYSDYSIEKYNRILKGDINKNNLDEISSRGYVVDTLEAAMWCVLVHSNYEDTILEAINLGNDTDTVAAIAGSMAGILYGYDSFPKEWKETLLKRDYLIDIAKQFEDIICPVKKDVILGTAIGDIVGSIYEINDCKTKKQFEFFKQFDRFTDDTVMTFAVAESLLKYENFDEYEKKVIDSMVEVGLKYPDCGYGPSFYKWLKEDHKPYQSYGNGAAMRISAIPVYFKTVNDIKKACKIVTSVSHNHPDSIIGAESICMSIHMSLNNKTKEEIKKYIEKNYFKLDKTVNELQEEKKKVIIKCLDTAKVSLICFMESNDYEDAIRNAISIGGDSDTIAAITGGIAAAYYGIPEKIYNKGLSFLDDYLLNIHDKFIKEVELNV